MKKVLSLVLVLTLVLGSFSFAFAAPSSDVAGSKYEDAVTRLLALNVLTGYPDGTFKPENTITRAEFAAAIIRELGLDSAAKLANGATPFSDVPASHWASGYINLASKLGHVNGMGDGTFAPSAPITYEQAVKLVMSVLGFEPAAQDRGGYPYGYIALAEEYGVIDGIDGVVGMPATRGLVALLLDNALDAPMMVQTGYGDLKQYKIDETKSILEDKLNLTSVYAQVVSVDTDDKEIVVKEKDTTETKYYAFTEKEEYDVMEGINIEGLENQVVKLWIKSGEVLNLQVKSEVKYDFINKINGKTASKLADEVLKDVEEITLLNADEAYDMAQDDTSNEDAVAVYEINGAPKAKTDDLVNGVFAKVTIFDDEVYAVEAYDGLNEGGLVATVKEDAIEYTQGDATKKLRNLDAEDVIVVVNGEKATYADLEENMYFDYDEYDTANDLYIVVATNKSETGTFDRINEEDGEVRIAGDFIAVASRFYVSTDEGESYGVATDVTSTLLDDLFKADVYTYLNNKGDVAYIRANVEEKTSSFYGFVTRAGSFNDELKIKKVVEGELETVVYDTAIPSDTTGLKYGDVDVYAYASPVAKDANNNLVGIYKFTVNEDDEITNIKYIHVDATASASTADVEMKEYAVSSFNDKNDYMVSGSTNIYADDASIFTLEGGSNNNAVELLAWDDIEGTSLNANGITVLASGANPSLIIISDEESNAFSSATDEYVGFITGRDKVSSDEYEYTIQTTEGERSFVIDTDSDKNASKYDVVVFSLTSDDEAAIVSDSVYASLPATMGSYAGVTNGTVDDVDGNYIDIDGVTYKVASDAVIYQVMNAAKDDYEVADINDIDAGDKVHYLIKDGVIELMFFER